MHLKEFFEDKHLYYILPNRLYFFLGAQTSDSIGEYEWDNLKAFLHINYSIPAPGTGTVV